MKKIFSFFLAILMLLGTTSCMPASWEAGQTVPGTQEEPLQVKEQSDIHLRDKDLLYQQYEDTEIVTMYLTVSTGNAGEGTNHTWEEVNTYSAYDYDRMGVDRYKVAGLLQVGDETGALPGELGYGQLSPNCTVQIRGQTSSKNPQKNYKISVKDNKGDWRGQTTIALNKHQTDGLRFRNKMGFHMISDIEQLMGLRTTFVRLYVKDTTAGGNAQFEDYGIYTQVEQLNKTALKAHGLDHRGHLYKINFCEFYRYEDIIVKKDDPRYDVKKFEEILEIKGDDDHTKLIRLLEKINDYSIPIEQILEENFDLENLSYWMAFNILVGNMDTQSRNFYLYSPQNVDRWYILAWDLDGMFRRTELALNNRSDYQEWESGISNYWGNVFFQRCLKSEVFRQALDGAVEDLRTKFSKEYMDSLAKTYADLIKPTLYTGRDLTYASLTPEEYDQTVASLYSEMEDNYRRYEESLTKPMPFFIGIPEKTNEGYTVDWNPSFDFDAEDVTYTFTLAKEYSFENPIFSATDLKLPIINFGKLEPGQYFMKVTSKNTSGKTQVAFDSYIVNSLGKIYGTKCFYVEADGTVVEDVYVEG